MTSTFFSYRRCNATSLAKSALATAAALGTLAAGQAQAYVVTVGGVQYDVTTFTGSYTNNSSKFATAANGGVMPWWGDPFPNLIASAFAVAVGSSLGNPNYGGGYGPIFAYDNTVAGRIYNISSSSIQAASPAQGAVVTYAQATLYAPTVPAPAPLPLLGAGAAFGFSRQLRKRIKRAPGALGSGLPRA